MENIDIDYKILARHFVKRFTNERSALEAMRISKQRYKDSKKSVWDVYIKAYNYDEIIKKGNENV